MRTAGRAGPSFASGAVCDQLFEPAFTLAASGATITPLRAVRTLRRDARDVGIRSTRPDIIASSALMTKALEARREAEDVESAVIRAAARSKLGSRKSRLVAQAQRCARRFHADTVAPVGALDVRSTSVSRES